MITADRVWEFIRNTAISGTASVAVFYSYIGVIEVKQDDYERRIANAERVIEELRHMEIFPEADVRLTAQESESVAFNARIEALENFKTQGKRCTERDCVRIENKLEKMEDRLTGFITECRGNVTLLEYRMSVIELNQFGDENTKVFGYSSGEQHAGN